MYKTANELSIVIHVISYHCLLTSNRMNPSGLSHPSATQLIVSDTSHSMLYLTSITKLTKGNSGSGMKKPINKIKSH